MLPGDVRREPGALRVGGQGAADPAAARQAGHEFLGARAAQEGVALDEVVEDIQEGRRALMCLLPVGHYPRRAGMEQVPRREVAVRPPPVPPLRPRGVEGSQGARHRMASSSSKPSARASTRGADRGGSRSGPKRSKASASRARGAAPAASVASLATARGRPERSMIKRTWRAAEWVVATASKSSLARWGA